ncbi:MAG: hypothetical protein HN509_04610 [Halobacteriovoraceae bacterium]|nr:hypothetical protein [Halobacteriovoraceae bacterium]MBT5095921.1 hypothetical protein [Halobacteriovoraceae bacterium]
MTQLTSKELLTKGISCFNNREYKKAQMLFAEIIEGDEKDRAILIDAFFHMANIFHLKGEIGKAIKAFNKVLSLDPCHTDASISLSVLYNDIGHYEEGKRVFEQANERVRHKKNQNAIYDSEEAHVPGTITGIDDAHINKKFSLKHYELAELYMVYDRFDEALFEYNKCITLDSSNHEARIKLAKVYARKNFPSKAFEELRRLKTEEPSYLPARVALGVLYYGNGKILEAQAEWQNVLSKDPRNGQAAMYLNLSKTATETTL